MLPLWHGPPLGPHAPRTMPQRATAQSSGRQWRREKQSGGPAEPPASTSCRRSAASFMAPCVTLPGCGWWLDADPDTHWGCTRCDPGRPVYSRWMLDPYTHNAHPHPGPQGCIGRGGGRGASVPAYKRARLTRLERSSPVELALSWGCSGSCCGGCPPAGPSPGIPLADSGGCQPGAPPRLLIAPCPPFAFVLSCLKGPGVAK